MKLTISDMAKFSVTIFVLPFVFSMTTAHEVAGLDFTIQNREAWG